MAATQRKLVHKQFNSPIGLYSAQNVKETLHRELKAFGGDGIEVDDSVLKPSNLANSAVLKALEEEENETYGGYKRVAWPPASETRTIREFTPQPSPQPPYQQQQQQQRPGASPVPAVNQGGHYIQSQPNYQSSYPSQQQQQQPQQQQQQEQPPTRHHTVQEPYYLQQKSPQQSATGQPSSSVSFSGGVAQPVYNTPRPNPQPQSNNYQYQPPQTQPHNQQQQQQLYQPQSALSPEPQPNYQQQQQHQQRLDEPPHVRWGHVASPIPQHTGYVQQSPLGSPAVQPPFATDGPHYGAQPQQQQQNYYGASSVPQVNQSYDHRQPSYGPPQQQQPVARAPAPAPAPAPIASTATPAVQQYYQAHQQPSPSIQPQQYAYSQTSQPTDNQYNYYSQHEPQPQQQQYQQLQQQQQYRGDSPGIITLRKEAPVTQQPAPVYTSQPAAASFGGGSNMRGDLKWPPPEYKAQAEVENEERRRIAQGPVCRPRRINKDYTQFFAKNALSHHYPSYKVPPGTQHMYTSY